MSLATLESPFLSFQGLRYTIIIVERDTDQLLRIFARKHIHEHSAKNLNILLFLHLYIENVLFPFFSAEDEYRVAAIGSNSLFFWYIVPMIVVSFTKSSSAIFTTIKKKLSLSLKFRCGCSNLSSTFFHVVNQLISLYSHLNKYSHSQHIWIFSHNQNRWQISLLICHVLHESSPLLTTDEQRVLFFFSRVIAQITVFKQLLPAFRRTNLFLASSMQVIHNFCSTNHLLKVLI